MPLKTIVSLFDGYAGARLSLEAIGITPEKYYASEIDKFAIQVSSQNYPDIIHLGDITKIPNNYFIQEQVDLLIGGSPCQNLSSAGDRKGLLGEKSNLFFEYLRLLKAIKPKYFILENVASMKHADRDKISNYLGVQPVKINSELFSPQKRNRYYWCNFPVAVPSEKQNDLVLKDVLEKEVNEVFHLSPIMIHHFQKHRKGKWEIRNINNKSRVVMSSCYKRRSDDNYIYCEKAESKVRMLTPLECERLQGIPDNYTNYVSRTQRYKMIGNGFNIPTVKYILTCLLEYEKLNCK
jgi:DNA-cytosine methyltransferase